MKQVLTPLESAELELLKNMMEEAGIRCVLRRGLWQLIDTLVPYAALWYLMYLSLGVSYWLTGALVLLAAGFSVRVFIIFHDCGHGSFFRSRIS